MPVQIKPRVKTTPGQEGKKSGAGMGQAIGAGLGGVIGAVPGIVAGNPMIAAKGAVAGASTGAGLGGIAGGLVQPGSAGTADTQEYISQVPTQQVSQGSQQILDGIRSLQNMPEARAKYLQPLTQAYIKTQMELKRRG